MCGCNALQQPAILPRGAMDLGRSSSDVGGRQLQGQLREAGAEYNAALLLHFPAGVVRQSMTHVTAWGGEMGRCQTARGGVQGNGAAGGEFGQKQGV